MYDYQFNTDTELSERVNIIIKEHVLKWGEILTDDECELEPMWDDGGWLRIRTIKYEGHIYYHKTINNKTVEFKELM